MLFVIYVKASIRDALDVKSRTPPNMHASFSSAPKKKISVIVKNAWSFHAI